MTATMTSERRKIIHLSLDDIRVRLQNVESEMEHQFGSVDNALSQEYTGNYPSELIHLFTEYHNMRFLLGK